MIRKHALDGNSLTAMSLFREMLALSNYNTTLLDDPFIYASLMKACNRVRAIREGKSVHCHVTRRNLDCNVYVLNSLVYFYLNSAGSMAYAREVFDRMSARTVVTVNCMVSGYVNSGVFDAGLGFFVQVLRGYFGWRVKPNCVTLVILISGCVECGWFLLVGKMIHGYIKQNGIGTRVALGTALINMYSKCGAIDMFSSDITRLMDMTLFLPSKIGLNEFSMFSSGTRLMDMILFLPTIQDFRDFREVKFYSATLRGLIHVAGTILHL
ncbi:hypothetical protein RJ639_022054 [Escallonia herrerae]|uniref:Pentatricopeptide repeat-containing protein n=1 Tax=Escallonia herrerae TaxID=1293975 RepID=A0AA88V6U4_9ASTE|nr:hypothetical protein RJ639_022054 [Escallonia herrerae]